MVNYRWKSLFSLLIGTFTVVLSLSIMFPASPFMMKDLHIYVEQVAWISLAYALSAAVFEPILGRVGNRKSFGRHQSGALLGMGFRFDFRGVRWGGLNYDLFLSW